MQELIEMKETMTSLELAMAFELQHTRVMEKLKRLSGRDEFNQCTCAPVDYKDKKGEARPMLIIDLPLAMGFAATSRKKEAPQLLMQLMMAMLPKQQPLMLEETEALKLENQALKRNLSEITIKTIANPRPHLIRSRHEELMEWVDEGWLEYSKSVVPKYKYRILDDEILTKTEKGTIIRRVEN